MYIIPKVVNTVSVRHDLRIFERTLWSDGTVVWRCEDMLANKPSDHVLETLYQELINEPVTTTNERPNLKVITDFCKKHNLEITEYVWDGIPHFRIRLESFKSMEERGLGCRKGFEGCDRYKNDHVCRCY